MVVDGIESYRRFELNENANGAQSIFFQFAMRHGNTIADTGTALLTIEDSDRSVVSSGNYERYFEVDGVLYHHILSTENGYPVNSGLSQVTILSDDSVTGDALSTLCFILGYEKATTLLENYPDVQAIFVLDDGSVVSYNY